MIKVLGVIPARFQSSRFPGKPLALIQGKPMIQWVYEGASAAKKIDKLIVATDNTEIFDTVKGFSGDVIMTPVDCETGIDRVALVAKEFPHDVILNIQGDEPLITGTMLDSLIVPFFSDKTLQAGTLIRKAETVDELTSPNNARVIIDKEGYAIYFTRAVIPYTREIKSLEEAMKKFTFYRHIGIYAFRYDMLQAYVELPQSILEKMEQLEQLRLIENGYKIKTVISDYHPVCVDVPGDIDKVEKAIKYISSNT